MKKAVMFAVSILAGAGFILTGAVLYQNHKNN